jgi:hypothetical protein
MKNREIVKEDKYYDIVVKTIPTEIVILYTYLMSIIENAVMENNTNNSEIYYISIFCLIFCSFLTYFYLLYLYKVRSVIQKIVAVISFLIWAYNLGFPFVLGDPWRGIVWYKWYWGAISIACLAASIPLLIKKDEKKKVNFVPMIVLTAFILFPNSLAVAQEMAKIEGRPNFFNEIEQGGIACIKGARTQKESRLPNATYYRMTEGSINDFSKKPLNTQVNWIAFNHRLISQEISPYYSYFGVKIVFYYDELPRQSRLILYRNNNWTRTDGNQKYPLPNMVDFKPVDVDINEFSLHHGDSNRSLAELDQLIGFQWHGIPKNIRSSDIDLNIRSWDKRAEWVLPEEEYEVNNLRQVHNSNGPYHRTFACYLLGFSWIDGTDSEKLPTFYLNRSTARSALLSIIQPSCQIRNYWIKFR